MKNTLSRYLLLAGSIAMVSLPVQAAAIRSSSGYGSPPVFSVCSDSTNNGTSTSGPDTDVFSGTTVTCMATKFTGGFPNEPVFTFTTPSGSPIPETVDVMFPDGALPGDFGLVQCSAPDTPATMPCTSATSLTDLGSLTGTAGSAQFTFLKFMSPVSVYFDVNAKITGITTVPEPATATLVVLPVAIGFFVRQKRREC